MIEMSTPTVAACGTCRLPVQLNTGHQAALAQGRLVYHPGCHPRYQPGLWHTVPCADCQIPVEIKSLSWRTHLAVVCDDCLSARITRVREERIGSPATAAAPTERPPLKPSHV